MGHEQEIDWCVGCGTRFVDLVKGYHIMAGYDNVIFGAGIPGVGSDGIMAGDARLNAKMEKSEVGKKVKDEKVCCEGRAVSSATGPEDNL